MFVRAYLRAAPKNKMRPATVQPLNPLLPSAAWYAENKSGTSLKRPEMFQLLSDFKAGDELLIEQEVLVPRLSDTDWER